MVEHRIFFPRDERTAQELAQNRIDDRCSFEVEEFTLVQKLELMRLLTQRAPQFRPKNGDPGKVLCPADLPLFIEIVSELRASTPTKELGSLLDRVAERTKKSRDQGLPILLFR